MGRPASPEHELQPITPAEELPQAPPAPKSPSPPSPHPPPYSPSPAPSPALRGLSHPYTPGHSSFYVTSTVPRPLRFLNRRHLLLAVPFIVILSYFFSQLFSVPIALPKYSISADSETYDGGDDDSASGIDAAFKRPHPTPLSTVPVSLVRQKKRIIFVGDVHGELEHLKSLLHKVDFDNTENGDMVVLLGDMVSKGHDSRGVVDWGLGQPSGSLFCVRGNHEDSILSIAARLDHNRRRKNGVDEDGWELETTRRGRRHGGKVQQEEQRLAHEFSTKQKSWLAACPVMLKIPVYEAHGQNWKKGKEGLEYLAVHAGLEAGVKLSEQDLGKVMNLRMLEEPAATDNVDDSDDDDSDDDEDDEDKDVQEQDHDDDDGASLKRNNHRKNRGKNKKGGKKHGGGRKHRNKKPRKIHWADLWNKWMSGGYPSLLPPSVVLGSESSSSSTDDSTTTTSSQSKIEPRAVVTYGHFAAKGLDIRTWTKGLDSACVKGEKLSALVVELDTGKEKVVGVDCGKKKKGGKGKGGKGKGGKKKGGKGKWWKHRWFE